MGLARESGMDHHPWASAIHPTVQDPHDQKVRQNGPRYSGATAQELEDFKVPAISDLLFDFVCVKALKKNGGASDLLPAESELLLGFQNALRNYDWLSAFIFSLQLYVDIHIILEDPVVHSFQQLEQTAHKLNSELPLHIDRATGPRRELHRPLRQRQRELERFMLNNVVLEDKLPRYMHACMDGEDVEDFNLLKHESVGLVCSISLPSCS